MAQDCIYMEEGPLVKMRLRRPSEPPGKGGDSLHWPSPAGVPTLIHKPDCYSQMHQNSKQEVGFQNKGLWEATRYDTETFVGIFHFYLKTHCFLAEALISQEHLSQCLLLPTLSARLEVSGYFRRSIFPTWS